MAEPTTILLTGGNSGLGLETAKRLGRAKGVHVVAGVRTPAKAAALKAAVPADRLTLLPLDLASLASVRAFADRVQSALQEAPLHVLAMNAGVQITTGLERTEDGFETTWAVNHLGHFLLEHRLEPCLAPDALVVYTASGTHDPADPVATRFDFRGGIYTTAEQVATGALDAAADETQLCLDRYATSKLCNILHVLKQARRTEETPRRYIAYDPGLMPGTDLARDRDAFTRFLWHNVLPLAAPLMRGVSSKTRSGKALARLLLRQTHKTATGAYIEYTNKVLEPWEGAKRTDWQDDLYDTSLRMIGE